MTLTAVDPVTGQRYYSPNYVNPRDEIPFVDRLVCPITLSPVDPVRRSIDDKNAHFRHKAKQSWPEDVISDKEYIYNGGMGESKDHFRSKHFICSDEGGKYVTPLWEKQYATTELRIYIPSKNRYRIADVALTLDNPLIKLVVEVQYSQITIHELQERTNDYFEAGWDVQWVFGPKNANRENYLWHKTYINYPAGSIQSSDADDSPRSFPYDAKPSPYTSIRNPTQTQVALL
jgi:competence CoiA-like predicted nuclease